MRILVVDDHILFRDGLISLLKSNSKYEIIGEAGTVRRALEQARLLNPDLILMDFNLPDGTGLEATKAILSQNPHCKIVFLTVSEYDDNLFDAIRSGASGYILKNVPVETLLQNLDSLEKGEMAISGSLASRVIKEFAITPARIIEKPSELPKLSRREIDILHELARESSNQEIAKNLFLSENTVKHHIHSILTKLELHDRREAARYARDHGLSN
jgi:two-component system NarL family response regulator